MERKLLLDHLVSEFSHEKDHVISLKDLSKSIPMPDINELETSLDLLMKMLFPGYFGDNHINSTNIKSYMGVYMHKLENILSEQIYRGYGFKQKEIQSVHLLRDSSAEICLEFLATLPEVKKKIYADIKSTFNGDPAAQSNDEIIYCYPGIKALVKHRIAHELFKLNVPVIPRIIAEMAHSQTGIDIHPGAQIGEALAIDHGTGVVIGETCIIGKNVKIYQGVTLGAVSFPLDSNGNPIKGIDRHPIIEDNVIIYSGATILGRVKIGRNSVIGGNVWLTQDVPPNSRIIQRKAKGEVFMDGSGI